MEKRRILKHRQILIAALFGAALLTGWCFWQNKAVRTTVYVIESSKLKPDAPDITIIQISDLHNAEFGDKQEKLIRKIKEAKPDIIAVTGDLIDSNHTDIGKAMELISQAATIAPVYFVTGNHEAWAAEGYIRLKREMENAGVHILDGISETFSMGGQQICLMGAKDPAFYARTEYGDAQSVMNEAIGDISCDGGIYKLLLSHRPELFQVYVDNGIDLVLAGHAHGGQFRLPFIGGVVAPGQGLFPKYTSGIFAEGETEMIVSRGLGNSIIPIRINNRPELVVVRITPAKNK